MVLWGNYKIPQNYYNLLNSFPVKLIFVDFFFFPQKPYRRNFFSATQNILFCSFKICGSFFVFPLSFFPFCLGVLFWSVDACGVLNYQLSDLLCRHVLGPRHSESSFVCSGNCKLSAFLWCFLSVPKHCEPYWGF
jgi:hypothetical protein